MPKKIISYIWHWTPAVIWMGFIFYSSSQSISVSIGINGIDKFFHTVEYFILAYLLVRAIARSSENQNYKFIFIVAVIAASLYGASDEFHQRFVPGRSCDIFDLMFDVFGSCLGAWLAVYKEKLKNAIDKAV